MAYPEILIEKSNQSPINAVHQLTVEEYYDLMHHSHESSTSSDNDTEEKVTREEFDQLDTTVTMLTSSVNEVENRVNSRIDNIIAHNNDTEGNSELIDIRTGADGNIYTSAGDAVRKQLSDTNNKLNIVDDVYSVDKLIHREVFVNDIDSEVSATVNPTVTGLRLVKGYEQVSAHQGQTFLCFAKISSDHAGANKYTVRAQKITSTGTTSTFYYPKQNGETIYDDENGVINGQIEITANDTIGVIFQIVRSYKGSATSSYTEKWNIEYCTIMDSNISYFGDRSQLLLTQFEHNSSDLWERGFYSESGKPSGSSDSNTIRTKKETFIQVCAGSKIYLADGAVRLRYCTYTKPDEDFFVERISIDSKGYSTITYDCYIRVYMEYTDSTTFDLETWIENLPPLWTDTLTQYNRIILNEPVDKALSSTSENAVQNKVVTPILTACKPTYFLSDEWENAVESIETAKTGKFTFIIQTDAHYVFNENETAGNDLRILTNKINLDFVANLGDIIQGYGNDSNVLMRASMMQIMDRYTNGITAPFLVAMGNHETNQQTAVGSPAKIPLTYKELFGLEFKPSYKTIPSAVFPDGVNYPMYYYVDFLYDESTPGVRVIVLNTQDGANEGSFGVGNTQKTWFANTALDTTLPVIVMSHVPLVNNIADRTDYNYSSTFADIVAALQTFKSNNGTVIACLSGHMHERVSKIIDNVNYIVFGNGKDKAEAVFVDLANKTITTKAIGFSANDRSFSYT